MTPIILKRPVSIYSFDTQATVAIARHRPEWLAIVRLAKDFGGEVTAEQVSEQLLAELPVGRKVIQRCVAMGLLSFIPERSSACLTDLGDASLQLEQVFVREQRLWRFYYALDPLLRQPLLHVEPLEGGSASEQRRESMEARRLGNQRVEDSDICPSALRDNLEKLVNSVATDGRTFIVKSIGRLGHGLEVGKANLQLEWHPSNPGPSVHLTGIIRNPAQPGKSEEPLEIEHHLTLEPDSAFRESRLTFYSVWFQLASHATAVDTNVLGRWFSTAKGLVLPRAFAQTEESARRHFVQDLKVPEVPASLVPELGAFDGTVLKQVNLVPATDEDAQLWASWLMTDGMNEYMTPREVTTWAQAVRGRFAFHAPDLPSPDELLNSFLKRPTDPRARFVLAPYDLGLWS